VLCVEMCSVVPLFPLRSGSIRPMGHIAVARAGTWAANHPEETHSFAAREIGAREDAVLAANSSDLYRHLGFALHETRIAVIESYKTFLLESGLLPTDFDVASWVDGTFLARAEMRATTA
jgi:ABC-type nitrate/sulfonate/bicarbonate transport system substrate-binding protein